MYKGYSFLGIIPARKNSKRLPKKNLLQFCGQPLVSWTINAGLNCQYIDKVIVTSDDSDVLNIASNLGVSAQLRPDYLSTDDASTFDTIQYVLEHEKEKFDFVVLLQPTSPLRNKNHVEQAIEYLVQRNANSVISVCPVDHSPLWSNVLPNDGNMNTFLRDEVKNKRSQDLQTYYRLNGAIYICKTEKLLNEKTFLLESNSYAFQMEKNCSIDIDDLYDFKYAEVIYNMNNK